MGKRLIWSKKTQTLMAIMEHVVIRKIGSVKVFISNCFLFHRRNNKT